MRMCCMLLRWTALWTSTSLAELPYTIPMISQSSNSAVSTYPKRKEQDADALSAAALE